MNSLFLGFVACFISYLIVDFLCKRLGIEKLINGKTSARIVLLLTAILFSIVGASIIEDFATRKYQFLLQSFLSGAMLAIIIFVLPVKNK